MISYPPDKKKIQRLIDMNVLAMANLMRELKEFKAKKKKGKK